MKLPIAKAREFLGTIASLALERYKQLYWLSRTFMVVHFPHRCEMRLIIFLIFERMVS